MYKDKDKQREAVRVAKARQRARQGMTKDVTGQGMTGESEVIPSQEVVLHPAIIAGINRLSTLPDGTIDESERSRRMAIATNYERMYPGRPYTGTGL